LEYIGRHNGGIVKTMKKIAIYGAGGFAREVAWLISDITREDSDIRVACFIDDDEANVGSIINNIPVLGWEQAVRQHPCMEVVVAIGSPKTRERIVDKVVQAGVPFATLIHPRVEMSELIEIGEGTIITTGNILTVNINIGQHVHINLDCTIGHDAILEDYVTLAPGVHISGWVHLERAVYIGTGAVIINGTSDKPIRIGSNAIIGAGAVVTKDIPSGVTAVGMPAKPLKK